MTQPLSSAAQAVIDAELEDEVEIPLDDLEAGFDRFRRAYAAAAIRALVEAKLPEEPEYPMGTCGIKELQREERQRLRAEFLSVANELGEMDD